MAARWLKSEVTQSAQPGRMLHSEMGFFGKTSCSEAVDPDREQVTLFILAAPPV